MLFSDLSCVAENTLKGNFEKGIFEMIEAQWVAIISLSKNLKSKIDAYLDIANIGNEIATEFLEKNKHIIVEQAFSYKTFIFQNKFFAIIPIRHTEKFQVFYLFIKTYEPFIEKDLKWTTIYIDTSYNKVLLNNELVQEHDFLENVLDSTPSIILVFDLNFNIISISTVIKVMYPDNYNNLKLEDLGIENMDLFLSSINKVISMGKRQVLGELVVLLNDVKHILSVVLSPLKSSKASVAGVVFVAADITQEQIISYEFEQLKRYSLLGEISVGLSHDVKNPLMNIRGCAGFLKRKSLEESEKSELLELIIQEVDRINVIIEQMMSFGKFTNTNNYSFVNINEALQNCIQIINRQKSHRQITIEANFCESSPLVHAQNTDIQQIFLNILINCVQSISENGNICITSKFLESTNQVKVSISDDGNGIKEEDKEKIFTPYFSTKTNGTGLGLFIVKNVLESYGAKIEINSTFNVGTQCNLYIPCSNNLT